MLTAGRLYPDAWRQAEDMRSQRGQALPDAENAPSNPLAPPVVDFVKKKWLKPRQSSVPGR